MKGAYLFARVPCDVIRDTTLSCFDKIVFVVLCDYANKDGFCFPSVASIAKRAGIGTTSVKKALNNLQTCGYIDRKGKTGKTNYYWILPVPVVVGMETGEIINKTKEYPPDIVGNSVDSCEQLPHPVAKRLPTQSPSVYPWTSDDHEEEKIKQEPEGRRSAEERSALEEMWKCTGNPLGYKKTDVETVERYFMLTQVNKERLGRLIEEVKRSFFLQGYNERRWKPSLLWCLKHREEIIGGKYRNYSDNLDEGMTVEL